MPPASASSDPGDLLRQAHRARAEHRFQEAFHAFTRADAAGPLTADDIVAWGDAAWWLGHTDQALELAELGHHRLVQDRQPLRAAKEAIGLGFLLLMRGELAAGSGWLQRGRSLLSRSSEESARGYLLHLDAVDALHGGELDQAVDLARQAQEAGRGDPDPSLMAMALMTRGTAQLRAGDVAEALALLDEAMLPVRSGRVAPDVAGNLYCQMIAICWELADLQRAREWTAATERWCDDFDSSVMFSGICRMHRVQLQQVAGRWDVAADGARVVCDELVGMNTAVVGEGHYLLGDLLRLRGDTTEAEAAYLRAHELGRDPQPGLALLTARAGQPHAALTSLRTALDARHGAQYARAPLLRAVVDIAVEAGQVEPAREAADELAAIARRWPIDGLHAAAAQAGGAARLAAGDAAGALGPLREAVNRWQELDAPYDCATSRMLLAQACASSGDEAAAARELDVAERTLTSLDATVDLRRLERLRSPAGIPGGLTPREAEVLVAVADGSTNRQVADALVVSEKTVARHLANIYLKLGVSTRTAAADWARRNGLRPSA